MIQKIDPNKNITVYARELHTKFVCRNFPTGNIFQKVDKNGP